MTPPFTVPCEGREAQFLHRSHWESNLESSHGSPLLYRCATLAPSAFGKKYKQDEERGDINADHVPEKGVI